MIELVSILGVGLACLSAVYAVVVMSGTDPNKLVQKISREGFSSISSAAKIDWAANALTWLILLLCTTMCIFLMYQGMRIFVGLLAFPITLGLGIMYMISNLLLMQSRTRLTSTVLAVMLVLLTATPGVFFSSLALHQAISVQNQSVSGFGEYLMSANEALDNVEADLASRPTLVAHNAKTAEVEHLLALLDLELYGTTRPGFGPRARQILDEINQIIDFPTSEFFQLSILDDRGRFELSSALQAEAENSLLRGLDEETGYVLTVVLPEVRSTQKFIEDIAAERASAEILSEIDQEVNDTLRLASSVSDVAAEIDLSTSFVNARVDSFRDVVIFVDDVSLEARMPILLSLLIFLMPSVFSFTILRGRDLRSKLIE